MNETSNTPGAPVPLEKLIEPSDAQLDQFLDGLVRCHIRESRRIFVRQWVKDWTRHKIAAQAISEREELAQLITSLSVTASELYLWIDRRGEAPGSEHFSQLLDRARAAAERLRGGGSDG
jgi:hypothetical protein